MAIDDAPSARIIVSGYSNGSSCGTWLAGTLDCADPETTPATAHASESASKAPLIMFIVLSTAIYNDSFHQQPAPPPPSGSWWGSRAGTRLAGHWNLVIRYYIPVQKTNIGK